MKFIKKQETINLVVVPCNVDIATTEALRMAQSVDPEGARTLGKFTPYHNCLFELLTLFPHENDFLIYGYTFCVYKQF